MALEGMFSRYLMTFCGRKKGAQVKMEEVLVNVEVSCKSGAQPTFQYVGRELCCQEINVSFAGILRVSVHHIQSASVASLSDLGLKKQKCSSWKGTDFSLKKKKKPWSALGVLGNCVLKKRTYISEDTPVTLACQEGRRCRKSTHRRGTPVGAKGEENLCSLCCIYSQREVVFGMSAWHQRIPVFYPAELLFLVGVAGRFPFLTRKGRGGYFP